MEKHKMHVEYCSAVLLTGKLSSGHLLERFSQTKSNFEMGLPQKQLTTGDMGCWEMRLWDEAERAKTTERDQNFGCANFWE